MDTSKLEAELAAKRRRQLERRAKGLAAMQRRRWIRNPARKTRDRYSILLEAAVDGTITDAQAIELGRLSRKLPNAVRARIERRGRQTALTL